MRRPTFIALVTSLVAACGSADDQPKMAASAANRGTKDAAAGSELNGFVTPSRLVPDLLDGRGTTLTRGGERLVLADRMRIVERVDGTVSRARELFPPGGVRATELPSRLGGGFLFTATSSAGTDVWRAPSWTGDLVPITQISSIADDVVVGLDRIYLRLSSSSRLVAVDLASGKGMGLGPLPIAPGFGALAFADGWRGVIVTDLRGPLATFDAGQTFRPVPVHDIVNTVENRGGNLLLNTPSGAYTLDARGNLTFEPPRQEGATEPQDEWAETTAPTPLGRRPLRTAVLRGFPLNKDSAVVIEGGDLFRVSLNDGRIEERRNDVITAREATCQGIRLGANFGFVCGVSEGPTCLYALEPSLALRTVTCFDEPRFVSPSGNGFVVVRGACEKPSAEEAGTESYCVVPPQGALVDLRVHGRPTDVGSKRVVALADGRIAVLQPPRGDDPGQLTVFGTGAPRSVALKLPEKPTTVARALKRGLWLEGFEERAPGVLGGWVEAGGPAVGITIDLTGKVSAGPLRDDVGGVIVSGPFALSMGETGHLAESTDGGASWAELDAPEIDEDPSRQPERGCGPLGCVFGPWIRVGWGPSAAKDDLASAPSAPPLQTPVRISETLRFTCSLVRPAASRRSVARVSPRPATTPRPTPSPAPTHGRRPPVAQKPATSDTTWLPFRDAAPPPLATDEVGFDTGPRYDSSPMRVYAWGKHLADWQRAGQWLVRFDDPFDGSSEPKSSATTPSPWPDEASASDAFGLGARGAAWSWGAELDPGGQAALVQACRNGACELFGVAEGQSIVRFRDTAGQSGAFRAILPDGSVRVGETWFYLVPTYGPTAGSLALYRVDLGISRLLASYERPFRAGVIPTPRLIRRASGTGLGMLFVTSHELGVRPERGRYYVFPIDMESGQLGDAIPLVMRDFSDVSIRPCAPEEDGWLFDTTTDVHPIINATGALSSTNFDAAELRVRIDPGSACFEGIAARASLLSAKGPASVAKPGEIPLSATAASTGERAELSCSSYKR